MGDVSANSEFIRVSADLPNELYQQLRDACFRSGVSHVAFIREAVEEKLEKLRSQKCDGRKEAWKSK